MKITLPTLADLTLTISAEPDGQSDYPTATLQKGLLLTYRDQVLAEEAVGFGVPVLKYGLQALFPRTVRLDLLQETPQWIVRARYTLNLVERIAGRRQAIVKSPLFYTSKDLLAALIRRIPALRNALTRLSSAARRTFGWRTTYESAGFGAEVGLVYIFDPQAGNLQVRLEPESLPLQTATELVIMNEQGARYFDCYEEPSGVRLRGKEIGCWDEVHAAEAGFSSSALGIRFSVPQVAGARLFRGRELVGSRLAWAGFGHAIPMPVEGFEYTLRLEKIS